MRRISGKQNFDMIEREWEEVKIYLIPPLNSFTYSIQFDENYSMKYKFTTNNFASGKRQFRTFYTVHQLISCKSKLLYPLAAIMFIFTIQYLPKNVLYLQYI